MLITHALLIIIIINVHLLGSPECTLYSESIVIFDKNFIFVPSVPGDGIPCYLTLQSHRFTRVTSHILHLMINVYITYNR